jgi:hypothetical protein
MGIPSQQIGWSQKSKLLWNISKQLERLTQVAGTVVLPSNGSSDFQWNVFDVYEAPFIPGTINFPNHIDSTIYTDLNLLGQEGYSLYINPIDSNGNDQSSFLSQLVGNSGILVLSQEGNSIVYNFTNEAFYNTGYENIIYYDNTFGPSTIGAISPVGYSLVDFNTTSPITISININIAP